MKMRGQGNYVPGYRAGSQEDPAHSAAMGHTKKPQVNFKAWEKRSTMGPSTGKQKNFGQKNVRGPHQEKGRFGSKRGTGSQGGY